MHILITADTVGGVWTYCRELVSGLLRRGVRVTLVSFGNLPAEGQTEWMESLNHSDRHRLAFYPTAFKLEWMQDSDADMKAAADFLRALIRESPPDLLHFNQFYFGSLHCDQPRVVVAHSDVVSWWASVHGDEPPQSSWIDWYRGVVSRGLNQATAVIAPSRWMLDQIQRYYLNPASGSVIYNGRSPELFNPFLTREESIISVGRLWDAGKNAALLLREELPAPLLIVGADYAPESAIGEFRVKTPPNTRLEPQQDEKRMVQIFGRASIYAAVSQYEPFGLAPVEAAFSGCAIVASDIPSFRELWQESAVFFHNNDAEDLRHALEMLVSDPELRRRYAELAYERALCTFSAESMVSRYLSLYRSLVPMSAAA